LREMRVAKCKNSFFPFGTTHQRSNKRVAPKSYQTPAFCDVGFPKKSAANQCVSKEKWLCLVF